jgi:hypothetical protein
VTCDREALCGSEVRVSMLLNNEPPALPVELGTIKWVKGNQFGVEFQRVPVDAQQRLNRLLRLELIEWLEKTPSSRFVIPARAAKSTDLLFPRFLPRPLPTQQFLPRSTDSIKPTSSVRFTRNHGVGRAIPVH